MYNIYLIICLQKYQQLLFYNRYFGILYLSKNVLKLIELPRYSGPIRSITPKKYSRIELPMNNFYAISSNFNEVISVVFEACVPQKRQIICYSSCSPIPPKCSTYIFFIKLYLRCRTCLNKMSDLCEKSIANSSIIVKKSQLELLIS